MSGLEGYLAAQTERGELEGSSHFTVSVEEGLRKLAAFQLPFAEAWILKIIQAAVVWRAVWHRHSTGL